MVYDVGVLSDRGMLPDWISAAVVLMFLRRWRNETHVLEEMRQRAALSRELPLGRVCTSSASLG